MVKFKVVVRVRGVARIKGMIRVRGLGRGVVRVQTWLCPLDKLAEPSENQFGA